MEKDLTDILSLVSATMFADKRVFQSEIDVFIKSTSKSNVVKRFDSKASEAKLLVWYEMNKDNIVHKLEAPYFKDWFYGILDRLKDLPDKHEVLQLMQKVSYADMDNHVSERALIVLSERYWKNATN